MIRIVLGNVGSGKTAQIVREIILSSQNNQRPVFTNIKIKKCKNAHYIKPEHIIKTNISYTKTGKEIKELVFNKEYWVSVVEKYGAINVVIDEAHNYFNPRRSMSKLNNIMANFLAMLRRILGSTDNSSGELILITQLDRRLDVIAREMATNVSFSVCNYIKNCNRCGFQTPENNEEPEQLLNCPVCNHPLKKINFSIYVWNFTNIKKYELWKEYRMKSYYKRKIIHDIETFFSYYNTLQFDELFDEIE